MTTLDPAFVASAMPSLFRERPILFSTPMVRATLSGAKTQTRRIVKPQPPHGCEYTISGGFDALCFMEGTHRTRTPICVPPTAKSRDHRLPCPYGLPGDRLWVRETFYCDDYRHPNIPPEERTPEWREQMLYYRADVLSGRFDDAGYWGEPGGCWKPSIHMPRWASRITLEITGVRVERLHDITDADARAEGAEPYESISADQVVPGPGFDRVRLGDQPHRLPFADLWSKINGAESWDANPWVWVVSFKRVSP